MKLKISLNILVILSLISLSFVSCTDVNTGSDVELVPDVTSLLSTPDDSKTEITWRNPSTSFTGIEIQVTGNDKNDVIILEPQKETFTAEGLTNGIEYQITATVLRDHYRSNGKSISVTPLPRCEPPIFSLPNGNYVKGTIVEILTQSPEDIIYVSSDSGTTWISQNNIEIVRDLNVFIKSSKLGFLDSRIVEGRYSTPLVIYVSQTTGNDLNSGTKENPKKTIQQGIDSTGREVQISSGTYYISDDLGLTVPSDTIIRGGYNSGNWDDRKYETSDDRQDSVYKTELVYSGSLEGSARLRPSSVFHIGNTESNNGIEIEGVTISNDDSSKITSGILSNNYSEAIVRNCTITGGKYGIYLSRSILHIVDSVVRVTGNNQSGVFCDYSSTLYSKGSTIYGNSYGPAVNAYMSSLVILDGNTLKRGVNAKSGTVYLLNNYINGTPGIEVNTKTYIFNNTIIGSPGIELRGGATEIINNIFHSCSTAGIRERYDWDNPTYVLNNTFSNCAVLYHDYDLYGDLTSIEDVNSSTHTTQGTPDSSTGNIIEDISYIDTTDYYTPTSVTDSVKYGGVDLNIYFENDRDNNTRTSPWSIGPNEID